MDRCDAFAQAADLLVARTSRLEGHRPPTEDVVSAALHNFLLAMAALEGPALQDAGRRPWRCFFRYGYGIATHWTEVMAAGRQPGKDLLHAPPQAVRRHG